MDRHGRISDTRRLCLGRDWRGVVVCGVADVKNGGVLLGCGCEGAIGYCNDNRHRKASTTTDVNNRIVVNKNPST